MYVSNYMTRDVITIQSSATISDALSLMNESRTHRIPVMKDGLLVGLITDGNIQKASPTKATSLSMFEINYLLSKSTVSDYMTKHVYTIPSSALLEEAVRVMREYNVSCLPVVDDKKLVGIITENDVFDALLSLLGFKQQSTRIDIEISQDKVGVIADITNQIKDHGGSITHMAVYHNKTGSKNVVIRINTLDADMIESSLQKAGYQVVSVTHTSGLE